jgi:hypothetical protein
MKKTLRKLNLSRETLCTLEQVGGGAAQDTRFCPSSPYLTCDTACDCTFTCPDLCPRTPISL